MNTREFYETRASGLLKELRESRGMSFANLQLRLQTYGVFMSEKAIRNIFYRPHKQFAQLLLILDAMGAEILEIPKSKDVYPESHRPGGAMTQADLRRRNPHGYKALK